MGVAFCGPVKFPRWVPSIEKPIIAAVSGPRVSLVVPNIVAEVPAVGYEKMIE